MLHVGLDLSRHRLDFCLLDEEGERLGRRGGRPTGWSARVRAGGELRYGPVAVRAAIESMNGARFVHDTLERCGWEVEVADAQKVKGLGAFGVQDRPDRRLGAGGALAPGPGAGDLAARGSSSGRSASGRGGGCFWSASARR